MKQSPDLDAVQAAMAPGKITLTGFLGDDTRKLIEILIDDNAVVERAGFDHSDIADRMQQLRDGGRKGLGEFVKVEPGFEVKVESVRGKLPCPFGDGVLIPKENTTVRNSLSDEEIVYSDLLLHMIREHGFYEGRGCPFRIGPRVLIRVLGMTPE